MACEDKCLQICQFVSVHSKLHIYIYNAFLHSVEGDNMRLPSSFSPGTQIEIVHAATL
jgi:hypothetical protein